MISIVLLYTQRLAHTPFAIAIKPNANCLQIFSPHLHVKRMPRPLHRPLVHLVRLYSPQPRLQTPPLPPLRYQVELDQKLHTKSHHRIRRRDRVAHQIFCSSSPDVGIKSVEIVANVFDQQRLQQVGHLWRGAVHVERDEAVKHKGALGGVDVGQSLCTKMVGAGEEVVAGVVDLDEVSGLLN